MANTADRPAAYEVAESFATEVDGEPILFRKGDTVHPDHKAVRRWPAYFRPLQITHLPKGRSARNDATAPVLPTDGAAPLEPGA